MLGSGECRFTSEHLSYRSFGVERRSGEITCAFVSLQEGNLAGEFSLVNLLKSLVPEMQLLGKWFRKKLYRWKIG